MTDNRINLTRRRTLLGLGAVGAAGAGAGVGTSALFSDGETFENNSITAGTLDMTVSAEIVAENTAYQNAVGVSYDVTANGAAATGLTLKDFKPGDWVIVCYEITVEGNPGYVFVQVNDLVSNENGFEEPEPEGGASDGEGELDDKLLTTVWDDYDEPTGSTDDRTGLSTLDIVTNNAASSFPDAPSTTHSWESGRNEGGEVNSDVHYTTLRETYDDWFDDGFLLGPGPDSDASKIGGPANDQESKVVYLLLEVPVEVGNEIQGDSVSFDLEWRAEQVRNNRVGTPATVPTTQQTKLFANDGDSDDNFGTSVAMDGDTVLIGAEGDEDPNGSGAGSAYVFTRSGGGWSQQTKLDANDGNITETFGHDVSVDGDTAVVGAPFDETTGSIGDIFGSAYVFTRSGGSWSQQAKLTPNDADDGDVFGFGVAVNGDTAVIGAPGDGDVVNAGGAAYVFTRSGSSWSQQAKFTPSDLEDNDGLGSLVALDGNTTVIGGPDAQGPTGVSTGVTYVFTRSGGTWSRQAKFTGDSDGDDGFGFGVAMDGDTAIIGASNEEDPNGNNTGSAYVFTRSGGNWSQQDRLFANDGDSGDGFGDTVAVDGDTAVVGAFDDEDPNGSGAGSAYVFTRSGGGWSQQTKLDANDGDSGDEFGVWVALDGSTAVVGAPFDDEPNGNNAGSAYVFGP